MVKLCSLRWRKINSPSNLLVGKMGTNYLFIKIRSGADLGKDDLVHDRPYAEVYLSSRRPFVDQPDIPDEK
jgi:hypothetical protein